MSYKDFVNCLDVQFELTGLLSKSKVLSSHHKGEEPRNFNFIQETFTNTAAIARNIANNTIYNKRNMIYINAENKGSFCLCINVQSY